MKALGKLKKAPGLSLYDAPKPTIGPNDVLIKIRKTALCGTDLHIYKWDAWAQKTVPVPITTGHEFMGIVEKVGSEVKNFTEGERVSGEGHLTCGHCRNCRAGKRHYCRNVIGIGYDDTGCFSEYFALPAMNVIPLPHEISDDIASCLDPLGNAVHTALAADLVGEDVLITGAGPLGIMAVAIARHVGARHVVITDVNEYRLNLAGRVHPTCAVNVTNTQLTDVMRDLGMTEGFDIGLEMSGNGAALNQMISVMNYGGKVSLLGIMPTEIAIDWSEVVFKALNLKGIYGREMFETWYKMISMLQSGLDVSPVITHIFPYTEFEKAFDVMIQGHAGKVILDWS